MAEVLLTDVRACGGGRFEAAASWPRSHPTFPRGRDDRHSPLVLIETMRQLGICIPLTYYTVSPSAFFLIKDVSFSLDPGAEPPVGHGATEITCLASVGALRTGPDGTPYGMRLRVRYLSGDTVFARAEGGARFLGTGEYAALRGAATASGPLAPVERPDPEALGVVSPGDVVVGRRGDTLVLDPADTRHPFFFDHTSDHVPGMMLLEAARQATALRGGGRLLRPLAGRLRAMRFTEHAPAAQVECAVYDHTSVVRFRQNGAHTAAGVLRYG